jgi:hypothetical protein
VVKKDQRLICILGNLLHVLEDCIYRIIGVSIRLMAWKTKGVPISSLVSREGGCGVPGWQGLKTESGGIADLMPRAREDPSALRTTPFQEMVG